MTRIEDRLHNALRDEAESRPVDVTRMRSELDGRLARPGPRRRLLPMVAAAVLLVGGGLVAVLVLDDDPVEPTSHGEVDDEFRCAFTEHVDLYGGQDEFLPDLVDRAPEEVAEEYDAPRWEFVVDGDTARLRLGNADGTLGSVTRYQRRDGEWRMTTAEACNNGTEVRPDAENLQLGTHGYEPEPPPEYGPLGQPVLVDDRPIYEVSGLVRDHRSLYLAPCGHGLCFATSSQDAIGDRMPTRDRLEILGPMCWFFVPDTVVGRASPYTLLVARDPTGRFATDFTVSGPGGTYQGTVVGHPSWGPQRVFLALVPTPPEGVQLVARLHRRGFADGPIEAHGPVDCD